MVSGKTAALIAACTECGALVAGAAGGPGGLPPVWAQPGPGFQAQDDSLDLGRFGADRKSSESDLVEGKKSLPVIYGLAQGGPFAALERGPVTPSEVPALAAQLEQEGARQFTQAATAGYAREALTPWKKPAATERPARPPASWPISWSTVRVK
jgi:geranylgeranyl diphosphate synthase type I